VGKTKSPKKLTFSGSSFGELQLLTLQRNAGFTVSHPYASSPINWPFLEWNQLLDGERFAETDLPAW
jgi:dolichyl-phosphate-mannose--protein O-mannosyl transferase